MKLWKINCMESNNPGLWQRWFKHQCVAVGWYSGWGFSLTGPTSDRGWSRTRNALQAIQPDDFIVVALQGNRLGRVGQVTGKAISDADWEPLVPRRRDMPDGEMGRRIFVRWDMTTGPDQRDMVVLLPKECRFTPGELRPTLCQINSLPLERLRSTMNDTSNWVSLLTHFGYEAALSDYMPAYAYHLEDGLLPHPDAKIREKVFSDRSRLDVLLIDRQDRPVVVECKRAAPSGADVAQLRHYLLRLSEETGLSPRGILVHGGARKLSDEVRAAAAKQPPIEIVRYELRVDFDLCT